MERCKHALSQAGTICKKAGTICKDQGLTAPLCWLLAGAAALCLFLAARGNRAWMQAWVSGVSMPLKSWLSGIVDPLPCSFAELSCTVAGVLALAWIGRGVWLAAKKRRSFLPRRLAALAAVGLWIYVLVCGLWGTQYYTTNLEQTLGIEAMPLSVEQLTAVTAYFAQKVNETAERVPRDESGLFAENADYILSNAPLVYAQLEQDFPGLAGPVRTPKKAFYSRIMSAAGFTGYLFPLAGESTLNVDCPKVLLPATVAHEISHQRGVAPEQEANFCAVLAATSCGDPEYEYSGWLFGYIYLFNALCRAKVENAIEVRETLCPEAMIDLNDNTAYWQQYEGPVKETAQKNYSNFIKGYGQKLGMASYGACVDLLVAWYLPVVENAMPQQ